MTRDRYPGIRSFEQFDRDIFFGRETEARDLKWRLSAGQIVVLYGKSGVGKSSLASIAVSNNFKGTIYNFRFPPGLTSGPDSLAKLMLMRILPTEEPNNSHVDALLHFAKDSNIDSENLWLRLKQIELQSPDAHGFVLVFDQFEEIFQWPESDVNIFKEQLAEVFTGISHIYYGAAEHLLVPDSLLEEILTPIKVKALIIIRSDAFHLLNRIENAFPSMFKDKIEIRHLTMRQAREALVNPAQVQGDYYSPPFRFEPQALEYILTTLKNENDEIEPSQLQMVGSWIESRIITNTHTDLVRMVDVQDIGSVLDDFYNQALMRLDHEGQRMARKIIEEGLIFETKEGEGIRLALNEEVLINRFQVSSELLSQLTNMRILRSEFSPRGIEYEIAHDSLLKPILKAKQRLDQKKLQEQLEQEKRGQKETFKLRKKTRVLSIIIALLFILNIILLYYLTK